MSLQPEFGVTIEEKAFEERFLALHKQLFSSEEFRFNDVTTHIYTPPPGLYQVDHSFFHDGENWHLFYVTGDMSTTDEFVKYFSTGDYENAAKCTVEPGIGHAVGKTLFNLEYQEIIEPQSEGDFDLVTRSNGWVFRHKGRYGMLYGVRGKENYVGFSIMWSDDLVSWNPGPNNPVFGPPAWTKRGTTCKDVHVTEHDGLFLLYYITSDKDGYCCIALVTTSDWETFEDQGLVFRLPPMLRGTMGIESPAVIHRNGMWHLFFTYGIGLWHAISPNPRHFVSDRSGTYNLATGYYLMGPFHATEVVQDLDGTWWLTTDRKEETRHLNRVAGRLCYRGSYEDEKTLEEGLYLSRMAWKGDQPILEKP